MSLNQKSLESGVDDSLESDLAGKSFDLETRVDAVSPDGSKEEDIQFDSGYSWVILFFATVICAFSYGPSGTYGVFLANFLTNNLYPGTSRMDFAFIGGLQYGVGFFFTPVCIYLLQNLPTFSSSRTTTSVASIFSLNSPYKIVIIIGAFCELGAYVGASFSTKKWHLYLSQGVLSGIGICLVYMTANALIPQWFREKRGLANGVFTAGAGLGSIIFSLSVQHLIDSIGLRWAQRYVGIFSCAMCLISSVFMFERKELFRRKVRIFDIKLFCRGDIWLAVVWGTITMFCCSIVKYTFSPYAVSVGLTHVQASILNTVLSVGIIVGRPLLGYLADIIGSINAALVSTILTTIFILAWWIPSHSYGSLIALALFIGAVIGSFAVGFPPIAASVVELEDFDTMISMTWAVIGVSIVFATPCAIGLTTVNNTYVYAQIFTGLLNFVSIFVLLGSRVFVLKRKNGEKGSFLQLYFKFSKV